MEVIFSLVTVSSQKPQWLPVNIAGCAIVEITTHSTPPKSAVYHIVNPNTSSGWDTIIAGLKKAGMAFDVVDRTEWLDRLARSNPDGESNPAIKLLVSGRIASCQAVLTPCSLTTGLASGSRLRASPCSSGWIRRVVPLLAWLGRRQSRKTWWKDGSSIGVKWASWVETEMSGYRAYTMASCVILVESCRCYSE